MIPNLRSLAERSERDASQNLPHGKLQSQSAADQNWCFTVKQLTNTNVDYTPVIDKFHLYGHVRHIVHERDSKNKDHIHGIIALRKGFLRTKLVTPNYNMKLDEVINEYQWKKYIYKDYKK